MSVGGKRIGWMAAGAAALLLALWTLRPQPVPVETAVVGVGPLQVTIDEDGLTRVVRHVEIAAPVSGRLTESPLRAGDLVSEGAVVGVLRPAPLDSRTRAEARATLASAQSLRRAAQAVVAEAAIARDEARRDRDRAERLAASGTLSQQELEAAIAKDRSREAELEAARARDAAAAQEETRARSALVESDPSGQGRTTAITLRSPMAGRVLRMFEEHDRVVPAGAPLIEIGDPRTLEIVSDVLSRDATAIATGMPMIVRVPGREPIRACVDRVEPSAFTKVSPLGVEEQRVNVVGTCLPESLALGLGDRFELDVSIVLWEADSVLKAPSTALVPSNSAWAVYVVDHGRAKVRPVVAARRGVREVQIVSGLAAGDRVIVHPDERLKDGIRVRPADVGDKLSR
ncbi:MAG TPA: HlyD family efflux transporter periplasmic adaptor subunit [Candidatus Eisenbacteria bacterium]|nr:HlyD family efflux transporter periplasmic adaptor subunit [Candidatus Eisenbacteria bacterium]